MTATTELLSIHQAVARGIDRVRLPKWAHPMDHFQLTILTDATDANGVWLGPWIQLYAPFNLECNGRDPVPLLFTQLDLDAVEYQPYIGPLPDSTEYKAAQQHYAGCLSER
jgi:hypothetical protein